MKLISLLSVSFIFSAFLLNAQTSNVALNKPAKQSSTYKGVPASQAVDGNTATINHTNAHLSWLEVDLGATYDITEIKVYNRPDYQERLNNFTILVSEDAFNYTDLNYPKESIYVAKVPNVNNSQTFKKFKKGRYVRIQLERNDFLHIAELEVFGTLTIKLGDKYEGGIVFRLIDDEGDGKIDRGLIAALTDLAPSDWFAAKAVCANYKKDNFTDWYLPNKTDLKLMYEVLASQNKGGFAEEIYWSSSQADGGNAWGINFGKEGSLAQHDNYSQKMVRAIRKVEFP